MSGSDDKTEAPTPKRKREARREGQIAKSQELVTWGAMLFGSMALPVTLRRAGGSMQTLFRQVGETIAAPSTNGALALTGSGLRTVLTSVLPIAVAMTAFAIVANIAQTGLVITPRKLKPSLKNLSLKKGFKRLFSAEAGWNSVKVLVRVVVLAAAAYGPLRSTLTGLASSSRPPLMPMLGSVASDGLSIVRKVCAAGLLLGFADYVVMLRRHRKSLRMTKHEIKEEFKQAEGDQHIKGHMRSRQREMSRNRMLAAVADASVVIVNPIHVAVALKYEAGAGAPRLVAKGKGEIARKIRERAEEHRVPLVRDIPLAWALHDTVPLDHPVPPDLYAAVAKVLAFVMTVGKRAAALGGAVAVPATLGAR